MSVEFTRLFSLGGFEALRALRAFQQQNSPLPVEVAIDLVQKVQADGASLDMPAAVVLNEIVPPNLRLDSIEFYQGCIEAVILARQPTWARIMTYGRQKFILKLERDDISCFRGAGLLEEPPTWAVIQWWDRVTNRVRLAGNEERLERARKAEELSLKFEIERLASLKIVAAPRWIAIEDNQAGYDIHSYDSGAFTPVARLIEVKCTVVSPLRFHLSRNEWNQAVKFGAAYHFHIWDLAQNPPKLYQRTAKEIEPHVPTDNEKGRWKDAEIPVGS